MNIWNPLEISLSPKGLCRHLFSSVIQSIYSLSDRHRLTPLDTCHCPCWSSHGPGISNMLGSPRQLSLHPHQCLPGFSAGVYSCHMVPSLSFFQWTLKSCLCNTQTNTMWGTFIPYFPNLAARLSCGLGPLRSTTTFC